MKEEFTSSLGDYICFTDEGIEFKNEAKHRMYPYGSMATLKFNFLGQVEIVGRGRSTNGVLFTTNKTNKKQIKSLTADAIKKNNSAPKCEPYNIDETGNKNELPTQEERDKQIAEAKAKRKQDWEDFKNKEHIMRCNVCGTIFTYTMKDIKNNIKVGLVGGISGFGAATNAVGGSAYNAYELNKMGDRNFAKIVDTNHCPNCRSSNLKEITEEELEKIKQEQNASATNTISAADELKKFKELLDMGAITQEEFDAKKKQLLGL